MSPTAPTTPPEVAVALELYRLAPGEFTAARNARAKEARAAGDRALATVVTGMRRPSVAAWAVNLLVRERPDDVEQLLATGTRLRAAQAAMDGAALRDLARVQHEQLAALRAEADELAAAAGQRLSEPVRQALDATLRAAMADAGATGAVRTGLLTTELVSTGFDPVEVGDAVAVPGAPPLLVPADGAVSAEPATAPDDGDDGDDGARVTLSGGSSRGRGAARPGGGGAGRERADVTVRLGRGAGTGAPGRGARVAAARAVADAAPAGARTEGAAHGDAAVEPTAADAAPTGLAPTGLAPTDRATAGRAERPEAARRRATQQAAARLARERRAAGRALDRAERRSTEAAAASAHADDVVGRLARRETELADEVDRLAARLAQVRAERDAVDRDLARARTDRDAAADRAERTAAEARGAQERLAALDAGAADPGPDLDPSPDHGAGGQG
ncbi:hypothetical protein [uncultured Cellulomonas sp.]|uniref:hypothetical protein n=1 Tax=uncultured Cellulomonas sp. TaxID=189682 RepID=UPI00262155D1|nr:hypothetical protein [uncultured Cellulomonas sp.]